MHAIRDPARVARFLLHHPAVRALGAVAAEVRVPAHLVGGALRDRLLGLPSADLDATLGDRGREVGAALAGRLGARLVALGGKQFGAYRLVGADFVLDLWDREGGDLAADLARRDLTVNAIALAVPSGEWVDPQGGLDDLGRRRLRSVRADSFASDPLRVLRLPRFWIQLPGFAVEPATLTLAQAAAGALSTVAAERVQGELDRIFRHPEADRALALLAALDLYPGLWLGHPGEAGATGEAVLHLARLAPKALELRQRAPAAVATTPGGATAGAISVDHRLARWAASFAELGPGAATHLEQFSRAGYLDKNDRAALTALLEASELPVGDLAARHFLHRHGLRWATVATLLGARATAPGAEAEWRRRADALLAVLARAGVAIFDPLRLLDGKAVGEILGATEGPAIGRALAALRAAQVEGRVTTPEEAVALVRGLKGAGKA